jgi:hypothetical protein
MDPVQLQYSTDSCSVTCIYIVSTSTMNKQIDSQHQ